MKMNHLQFLVFFLFILILAYAPSHANGLTISWTGPANNSQFDNCADITLSAEATIEEGSIKRVEFYQNGARIKSDTAVPYEHTMTNVPNGLYSFYAKAVADDDTEASSGTVLVNVGNTGDGDLLLNGEFNCQKTPWRLDTYVNSVATFEIVPDLDLTDDASGAFIDITEMGDQFWAVQLMQPFKIQKGHTYEVSFVAEADEAKDIQLTFSQDYDPWEPHWTQDLTVEDPQEYGPYTYECDIDDDKVMFKFILGGNTIPISIDAVKVVDKQWTAVDGREVELLHQFNLGANYPNPFNPSTRIEYSLAKTEEIEFSIYDMLGKKIYSFSRTEGPGSHTFDWNGYTSTGLACPSGVYFYRLKTNSAIQTRRMLLVR